MDKNFDLSQRDARGRESSRSLFDIISISNAIGKNSKRIQ